MSDPNPTPGPSDVDYVRRRYRVPPALEDDFAAWLVASCGALGCQVQVSFDAPPSDGPVELDAWFDAGSPSPAVGPARWPGVEARGADGVV
ncbi:MAG: hypothetical protein AAFY88_32370 [Acidobacteriota bacterium]